ncbi:hypothetical protein [Mesobacillus jeotgali]|uniref:hypothetical protein n=1 Tax=Mesobacillus jeotgali TaxID=129985 RepID=UPI0009A746B7|nr:hypothetical protein [Mesobacillus jeotgali]
MLTIKEAAEQFSLLGIETTDDDILILIREGQLNAEKSHRRNKSYLIHQKDVIKYIVKKQQHEFNEKLEKTKQKNQKLKEELEMLTTRLHIEKSKVRTLKKMLNLQIEASAAPPSELEEFLGLKRNSSNQVIKKEFKKILKALHPDRGGDERLFKVFRQHYEKL